MLLNIKNSPIVDHVISNITYNQNSKFYAWKNDLNLHIRSFQSILDFPQINAKQIFNGPTIFIKAQHLSFIEYLYF